MSHFRGRQWRSYAALHVYRESDLAGFAFCISRASRVDYCIWLRRACKKRKSPLRRYEQRSDGMSHFRGRQWRSYAALHVYRESDLAGYPFGTAPRPSFHYW